MTTLGDIDRINQNINNVKLKVIQALHTIAFGEEGRSRAARRSVRDFAGFGMDEESEEYREKVNKIKEDVPVNDVMAVCHVLNLDYTGSQDAVVERVCSFLNDLKMEDEEAENENEGEEEHDGESELESELDDEPLARVRERVRGDSGRTSSFARTFRDVEGSIRNFDGKDDYPVGIWIEDLEEIAEITGWNELQKLIFAKKALTGLAKLFIQSEKGIKSWALLKKKLKAEFEVKVNSTQIHKLLMTRKKGLTETVQEYALIMREIGSRAALEAEVIINYVIDGIPDDSSNKIILYGARSFAELKEKIKLYEQIRTKKTTETNRFQNRDKNNLGRNKHFSKDTYKEERSGNGAMSKCFNCGGRGHQSKNCPHKSKGIKCFKCNDFGHLASQCPKKETNFRNAEIRPMSPS